MLTKDEYNELLPYRADILNFNNTNQMPRRSQDCLYVLNRIKQRLGQGAICFDCSGSKVQAIIEGIGYIVHYEEVNGIKTV